MSKKKLIAIFICAVLTSFMLTGCASDFEIVDEIKYLIERISNEISAEAVPPVLKPVDEDILNNLSDEYLVGFSNVGGEGPRYAFMSEDNIVTTDGRFICIRGGRTIYEAELPQEAFEKIKAVADPKKIMKLTARPDDGVCDGSSKYIYLYGEDGERIFSVGAYMPIGKSFMDMYSVLSENTSDAQREANSIFIEEIEPFIDGVGEYFNENLPNIGFSWELMEDLWGYGFGKPTANTTPKDNGIGDYEFLLYDDKGMDVLVFLEGKSVYKEIKKPADPF